MKQLLRKFKQISILILAIAFIGCDEENAVLPEVVAGFTYTVDEDTNTVTFINTSENANKYTWSFGDQDGTTSNLIDPVFTFPIGSYTIVLTAKNVAGASDTFEDTIVFLDRQVPLITLTGDATINVTLGDDFTDPGATALDAVDGDITANIVVGGDTVDTNTEGTYVITYNVSDAQGNAALEVERTVNVSAIACEDETEQSLSAANLNMTFLSDPGTTDTKGSVSGQFFQDNVGYEYADNPDVDNDVNKSCKVAKVTKAGIQPWDNLQIDFDDKFTFADGDNFTIKVYSPVSGYNVSIKLEDKTDGGIAQEIASTTQTTKTNEWEELTIPFGAGDSGKFDRLVIFFDVAGPANTNVYYFDDLKLNSAGGGGGGNCVADSAQSLNSSDIDMTFASDPGTTDTKGSVSGQFFQDNVGYEYVDNPKFDTGINNSCKVAKVTKAGIQPWDNLQIDFDDKFTFADGDNFTIKVYSPVSGYNVSIKLEDKTDGGIAQEIASTTQTTKINEWEELTIPFGAGDSGKFDRLVIFFDVAGPANTNVYYFDDLKLNRGSGGGGGGGGACPAPPSGELLANGGFEANNGDGACWQFNLNGGTAAVSTEQANAGTYSAKLTTGANQAPNIKWERFASTIAAGTTVEVTFKYRFTTPLGTGSILQVLAFSEKTAGAVEHNMGNATDQPLNTWNTFTGTFVTAGDIAEGISLLLQLTGSGNADGGGVVYIDDVVVKQL